MDQEDPVDLKLANEDYLGHLTRRGRRETLLSIINQTQPVLEPTKRNRR